MSDLLEKVEMAVEAASAEYAFSADYKGEARAAIRTVLSHFAEAGNVTDGMQQGYENLFDPLSEVHTRKAAISAAMAAALKEMER